MEMTDYTVGGIAELTGVSIRTLHHYDEIGLLEPSERSAAGYRLYSLDDLARLQRILFYRELGFDLAAIGTMLADPARTVSDHLGRQRVLLAARIERDQRLLSVVDKELAACELGMSLTAAERLEVFGSTRLEDRAGEVSSRWGDTEAFRERVSRSAKYTKADWEQLRGEQADIHRRLAAEMVAGSRADSAAVMDLAEEHRRHLERWFHPCGYEAHRELAVAYRDNQRTGRNFDDMAPGLSHYIHDAIVANCDRAAAV